MYPTVEVRWFYQGEVPTAVLDWYTAVDDAGGNSVDRR